MGNTERLTRPNYRISTTKQQCKKGLLYYETAQGDACPELRNNSMVYRKQQGAMCNMGLFQPVKLL